MFDSDRAYAAGAGHPRFLTIYQPNGNAVEKMWPAGVNATTRSYSLRGCSLEPLEAVKSKITVIKGMENVCRGVGGNGHLIGIASYLSGSRVPNDDVKTWKISVDQFIADHYAKVAPTRKHTLQLSANNELDASSMEYNNLLKNTLSFDRAGRLLPNTNNLGAVFEDLFSGSSPTVSGQQATQRQVTRKSVLDFVLADARDVGATLGREDRTLLTGYLDGIRDLERELGFQNTPVPAACNGGSNTYGTFPQKWDRVGDHWKLTAKLLALAFQCEVTRSVTYMLGGEAAGATYPEIGINAHVHNTLSHSTGGTNRTKYAQVDRYHAELFAHTIDVFEKTPVGAGTLLDNTLLLWGTGLGDGATHQHNNLLTVLAGNVGSIKHGAFQALVGRKNSVLMNTILKELGVPAPNGFGDAKVGEVMNLSV